MPRHECRGCNGLGWTFRGFAFTRMECPVCRGCGEVEADDTLPRWVYVTLAAVAASLAALWAL